MRPILSDLAVLLLVVAVVLGLVVVLAGVTFWAAGHDPVMCDQVEGLLSPAAEAGCPCTRGGPCRCCPRCGPCRCGPACSCKNCPAKRGEP